MRMTKLKAGLLTAALLVICYAITIKVRSADVCS